MLERTLISKFCNFFLVRGSLKRMPVIMGVFCWTLALSRRRSTIAGFSFPEALVPFGLPSRCEFHRGAGRSRTPSSSFGFSLLLWIVFHSTLLSSTALTFCPLDAISTVSFFRCPWSCPWPQQRHFSSWSRLEMRNASHKLSLQVWCPFTFVSSILNVQRQQCFSLF